MLGPPMSMFSIASSGVTPFREIVSRNGYRFTATRSIGCDVVLLERRHVLGHVAPRQQSAVDRGMQRLHATVHHLGKAGHVADVGRGESRLAQGARRATGRDELPTELRRARGQSRSVQSCPKQKAVHEAWRTGRGLESVVTSFHARARAKDLLPLNLTDPNGITRLNSKKAKSALQEFAIPVRARLTPLVSVHKALRSYRPGHKPKPRASLASGRLWFGSTGAGGAFTGAVGAFTGVVGAFTGAGGAFYCRCRAFTAAATIRVSERRSRKSITSAGRMTVAEWPDEGASIAPISARARNRRCPRWSRHHWNGMRRCASNADHAIASSGGSHSSCRALARPPLDRSARTRIADFQPASRTTRTYRPHARDVPMDRGRRQRLRPFEPAFLAHDQTKITLWSSFDGRSPRAREGARLRRRDLDRARG